MDAGSRLLSHIHLPALFARGIYITSYDTQAAKIRCSFGSTPSWDPPWDHGIHTISHCLCIMQPTFVCMLPLSPHPTLTGVWCVGQQPRGPL
jgi:hypothetical protein